MKNSIASGIVGIIAAFISGVIEYFFTGGTSTLIPLWAGVLGTLIAWIVSHFLFRRKDSPREVIHSEVNEELLHSEVNEEPFYTPRTPTELLHAIRGRTSIEAEKISERHIGSRIRVSGEVNEISKISEGYSVMIKLEREGDESSVSVFAHFDESWSLKLGTLEIGDQLNIDGEILDINKFGYIRLTNSRFTLK